MFINFTNHPSDKWSAQQLEAAHQYGEIVDIHFPDVPAAANEEDVYQLADGYVNDICLMKPDAVLCQGEMTLTWQVVTLLKKKGIRVVSACSERCVQETTDPGGNTVRLSVFSFKQFREYGRKNE